MRRQSLIGRDAAPLLLLLIWAFASAYWSVSPFLAFIMACKLGLGIGVAWAAAHACLGHAGRLRRWLVGGLLLAALAQAAIALAQTFQGGTLGLEAWGELVIPQEGAFYRGNGLTVHPNNLAGLLVVALGAALLWTHTAGSLLMRRALPIAVIILLMMGVFATGSRAAVLGCVVMGAVGSVLLRGVPRSRRLHQHRRRLVFGAVVIMALLVGLLIWGAAAGWLPGLIERLFAGRRFHLRETWEVITLSPLLGAGIGNLMPAIAQRYFETQLLPPVLPAHNAALMIWAEVGLVGVLLLAWVIGGVVWRLRHVPAPFLLVLLAAAAISMVDYYWWGDERMRGLLVWWVGVGMAFARGYDRG